MEEDIMGAEASGGELFLWGIVIFGLAFFWVKGMSGSSETHETKKEPLSDEECYLLVEKLVKKIGISQFNKNVFLFDEDTKPTEYLYTFAVLKVPKRKMWVIFYPGFDDKHHLTVLVFDAKENWSSIVETKNIINDFNNDEAELVREGHNYPYYLWGNTNYVPGFFWEDIAKAATTLPSLNQIL